MLDAEGLEYELYSDRPGTKYGRHKHPFDDFVVIVTGKMKIITDAQRVADEAGGPAGSSGEHVHSAEMIGKEEVQYLSAAK